MHLEKIGKLFQVCHSSVILLNLPQSQPSLFSFGLLLLLRCFSTLGNYYFEVSFDEKISFSDQENG